MADEQHRSSLVFDAADEYRPEPPLPPEIPSWKDGSFRIGIHTSIAGDITGALETARARGLKVVARCSFVRDFLAKHPEYHDLMP